MSHRNHSVASSGPPASDHLVHFYDEEEALIQSAASFLAGGLLRGAPSLLIVKASRAGAMNQRLSQMGVDLDRAGLGRQLVHIDSESMVDRLLIDGVIDEGRFRDLIGAQVASMTEIWRPLRIHGFGDMVDVLSARNMCDAAIELERLWDDLAQRHGFALYCAYDSRRFAHKDDRGAFDAICSHHGVILPVAGQHAAHDLPLA